MNSGYNPGLLDILDTSDPEKFKSSANKLQLLIDKEKRKAQPVPPLSQLVPQMYSLVLKKSYNYTNLLFSSH